LASTNVITTPSSTDVYRYDFPAIDTYSGGFSDAKSISQIASETLALKEVVSEYAESANITGGLTCDTITTTTLNVEATVNIDSGKLFDTLVVRRPTGFTGVTDNYFIILREIQVWVNGINIMIDNGVSGHFADFDGDKSVSIGFNHDPAFSYNNIIESDYGSTSPSSGNNSSTALVIKSIPLTAINDIQAIIYYNKAGAGNADRVQGLAIELYNEENDPDLTLPLANTNEISITDIVYRFNFPSIGTYSDFVETESIDFITNDATTETANYELTTLEVKGNASISNDLLVGGVNIITELGTKQDEIQH
jgi:hypothetical protein